MEWSCLVGWPVLHSVAFTDRQFLPLTTSCTDVLLPAFYKVFQSTTIGPLLEGLLIFKLIERGYGKSTRNSHTNLLYLTFLQVINFIHFLQAYAFAQTNIISATILTKNDWENFPGNSVGGGDPISAWFSHLNTTVTVRKPHGQAWGSPSLGSALLICSMRAWAPTSWQCWEEVSVACRCSQGQAKPPGRHAFKVPECHCKNMIFIFRWWLGWKTFTARKTQWGKPVGRYNKRPAWEKAMALLKEKVCTN